MLQSIILKYKIYVYIGRYINIKSIYRNVRIKLLFRNDHFVVEGSLIQDGGWMDGGFDEINFQTIYCLNINISNTSYIIIN